MKKQNPGLIALAFGVCCLSGCGPTRQIAISPDGKTAVITNQDEMIFRDLAGRKPDRIVKVDDRRVVGVVRARHANSGLYEPTYSPNGQSVIVQGGAGSVLVDTSTRQQTTIPHFMAPFAWNPNGSEVVGLEGRKAKVYHIRSHEIVRTYDLPQSASKAVWVGSERDVAFAGSLRIDLLHNGKIRELPTDYPIAWLGYDKVREKLEWIETYGNGKEDLSPNIFIKQVRSDLTGEAAVLKRTTSKVLLSSTTAAFPITIAISPDGQRVACCGLTDASAPGLLNQYFKLSEDLQRNQKNQENQEKLEALSKRLRFRLVNAVTPLRDGANTVAVLYRSGPFGLTALGPDLQSVWMPDGNAVAMFWGDKIRIQPLTQ